MIRVLFLAQAARWMGVPWMEYSVAPGATLRQFLKREQVRLAPVLGQWDCLRIAVNQEFADQETLLYDGDEIAFLPPVSGG